MPTANERVVLRVFAVNPATQIVVVDPLEGAPESARGTGELSLALAPGHYSIVHWVGSREPREEGVTLEPGMAERTLEIRDVPHPDPASFAWLERLRTATTAPRFGGTCGPKARSGSTSVAGGHHWRISSRSCGPAAWRAARVHWN